MTLPSLGSTCHPFCSGSRCSKTLLNALKLASNIERHRFILVRGGSQSILVPAYSSQRSSLRSARSVCHCILPGGSCPSDAVFAIASIRYPSGRVTILSDRTPPLLRLSTWRCWGTALRRCFVCRRGGVGRAPLLRLSTWRCWASAVASFVDVAVLGERRCFVCRRGGVGRAPLLRLSTWRCWASAVASFVDVAVLGERRCFVCRRGGAGRPPLLRLSTWRYWATALRRCFVRRCGGAEFFFQALQACFFLSMVFNLVAVSAIASFRTSDDFERPHFGRLPFDLQALFRHCLTRGRSLGDR